MTAAPTSRSSLSTPSRHPNLAQVLEQIIADDSLTPRRRQDISSALHTLAKALGRPLEELEAHPFYLFGRINGFAPAIAGLTESRWRNVRCLTRFALKQIGLAFVPGRYREPLAPEWEGLYRHLNAYKSRHGLSRLAHYSSVHGITPEQINDEIIGAFLEDLRLGGFGTKVPRIHRSSCMLWNRAAAGIAVWPKQQLSVPDYRDHYVLPWSTFPATLKHDFDAYMCHLSGKNVLEDVDFRHLGAASIETRSRQLREYISAVVHRGRDPQTLHSLADLVPVATVKEGLRFLLDRFGGKPSKQMLNIACVITSLARHWVKVGDSHLTELKSIRGSIKQRLRRQAPETGPTQKNLERLRPFKDKANLVALMNLPRRLMAKMPKTGKPTRAQALEAQSALAIELLIMKPLRIKNLAALDLDRHIIRSRPGGVVSLAIAAHEVKNDFAIEAELPLETVNLLDVYLTRYRPVLSNGPSSYLFPGRDSRKPKHRMTLGPQITACIKRHCGFIVHPHLFRHIAAMSYLREHPGAYGVVRLVLDHLSVDTTAKFYCFFEGAAAMRHFDEHILKLREVAAPPLAVRRRRRAA